MRTFNANVVFGPDDPEGVFYSEIPFSEVIDFIGFCDENGADIVLISEGDLCEAMTIRFIRFDGKLVFESLV